MNFRYTGYTIAMLMLPAYFMYALMQQGSVSPPQSDAASAPRAEVAVLAPGWGELDYPPPPPGTYELPRIEKADDGEVLLDDGSPAHLKDFLGGKFSLLTFIYTQCTDTNGCPLTTFVFHALNNLLKERDDLREQVRFISLSFDPERDTPEVMRAYGDEFNDAGGEWHFMTTESDRKLQPILKAYNQYVLKAKDEEDRPNFSHIIRAYLIDRDGYIRNIYSVDFLHPESVLADMQTLLLEEGAG